MVFGGLQKLTLLDYPGFTACTAFVAGCDFACPFCHNTSLIEGTKGDGTFWSRDDQNVSSPFVPILDFLKTRQGLLDGVCISGGEPLLQEGLESFIDKVKELGFFVKIDTNGSSPDKLKRLIESGKIDFVAMDIKNSPVKYAQTIGLPDYDVTAIEDSINLLRTGTIPFEFRTTVVKEFHTEEDLLYIARWISGASTQVTSDAKPPQISGEVKYFLQKFVESDGVKQKGLHSYSDKEMKQLTNVVKTVLPTAELRGI